MTIDDLAKTIDKLSDDVRDSNVLSEQIREDNRAILEGITGVREELARVPKREEFQELANDVKAIKAVLKDHSSELDDHRHSISELQTLTEVLRPS